MFKWLFFFLPIFLNVSSAQAEKTYVAVAANFAKPMVKLKQAFSQTTGHQVLVSIGSTGQLYAQIIHGAPYEVFLAADTKRPQQLIKEQYAHGTVIIYALGQLVLWSKDASLIDEKGHILHTQQFKHLAIANPKTAPYGLAAQQVLEKLDLWEGLQSRIVQGNNIGQAYQFIATNSAQLGFIAYSQYLTEKQGSYWLIPSTLYTPIQQGAVLLKRDSPVAEAFCQFLQTSPAREIIKVSGYIIPEL